MYYAGNLAYKMDYADSHLRQGERISQLKTKKKTEQKKVVRKVNEKGRRNSLIIFRRTIGILMICAAAAFMITKYVQLDALDREVKTLSKEVESMRSVTSQKIKEMDQGLDLEYIEEKAIDDLNMQRPEKYQQIYVDVKRDDVTDVTAGDAESFRTIAGEAVGGFVSNIIDRFSIR